MADHRVGKAFRHLAGRLEGIDLSPKMLDRAKARGVYDELHTGDFETILPTLSHPVDLLLFADVLIYFDDLSSVIRVSSEKLAPGGIVGFTLELPTTQEQNSLDRIPGGWKWRLGASGRNAHNPKYVHELAEKQGFRVAESKTLPKLRREAGETIPGTLMILEKER
uniref:Methyltransferase type 11 domain-containing protein n=1 Tax=Rhizochromulina marina TaxID=1034831 RepID=A0A7S2W6S2_9STRA